MIYRPEDASWSGVTLTMMSYGYGLRLTPLKTLSFYNAIANGGKMVRPMFVKELKQYGQTLRTFPPEVMVESIGSPEVIKQVQDALKGVVNDGTARGLKNPYYSVAGKTGTAQIAMGRHGYTDRNGGRHYLATLVGYFLRTIRDTVVSSQSRPIMGPDGVEPIMALRWLVLCSVLLQIGFMPGIFHGKHRFQQRTIR